MPTFTTNSARWRIFDTVASALEQAPELQGVKVKRNPTAALRVEQGQYVVVVRWNADSVTGRVGNAEERRFQLLVGSIANTAQSDRDADAMHQVVGGIWRGVVPALNALAELSHLKIEENEATPDLDNILVEGALVLSVCAVSYRQSAYRLSAT